MKYPSRKTAAGATTTAHMFHVRLVLEHLYAAQFDNETKCDHDEVTEIPGLNMSTAVRPRQHPFDCSGLTQWRYGVAGITLPRTAQAQ